MGHKPLRGALGRDVSHQSAHVPEIAQVAEREIERKAAREPVKKLYTMAEPDRPQDVQQFAWRQETGPSRAISTLKLGATCTSTDGLGNSTT